MVISDPCAFLFEKGDLHDAYIDNVIFNRSDRILRISIDDINKYAKDTDDYPGTDKADLVFSGVDNISFDLGSGLVRIWSCSAELNNGAMTLNIDLSKGEGARTLGVGAIQLTFASLVLER